MLLRDDQWEKISKLVPGGVPGNGKAATRKRLFVETVLWVVRTGSPWRELPVEFGKWFSARIRFERWSEQGVWEKVFAVLLEDV